MHRQLKIPKARFVETDGVKDIAQCVKFARQLPQVVTVTGPPGSGKTTALRNLAKMDGTYYAEVVATKGSMNSMLKMLLDMFGVYVDGQRPSAYDMDIALRGCGMEYRSAYHLDGNVQPILVLLDEVQNLDAKALRHLLSLQEHNGWSMILSGNDVRLKQTKITESALGQIARRIDWRITMGVPSERDCQLICAEYDVDFDQIEKLTRIGTETSVDTLTSILKAARLLDPRPGALDNARINPAIVKTLSAVKAAKYLAVKAHA